MSIPTPRMNPSAQKDQCELLNSCPDWFWTDNPLCPEPCTTNTLWKSDGSLVDHHWWSKVSKQLQRNFQGIPCARRHPINSAIIAKPLRNNQLQTVLFPSKSSDWRENLFSSIFILSRLDSFMLCFWPSCHICWGSLCEMNSRGPIFCGKIIPHLRAGRLRQ